MRFWKPTLCVLLATSACGTIMDGAGETASGQQLTGILADIPASDTHSEASIRFSSRTGLSCHAFGRIDYGKESWTLPVECDGDLTGTSKISNNEKGQVFVSFDLSNGQRGNLTFQAPPPVQIDPEIGYTVGALIACSYGACGTSSPSPSIDFPREVQCTTYGNTTTCRER